MKTLRWIKSFIPVRMPIGLSEFNQLVEEIVTLSGVPLNPSTEGFVAQALLNLPPGLVRLRAIAAALRKAACTQVAVQVIKDGE